MSLKVCIETLVGNKWFDLPSEDLPKDVSNFVGARNWDVAIVTGLKEDGITSFISNCFHNCDLFQLNEMLMQLEGKHSWNLNDLNKLYELNLLLEDNNYNCDEVLSMIEKDSYRVFKAASMEEVAIIVAEDTIPGWNEMPEVIKDHFSFESYGETLLSSSTWLEDERNGIIIELF